jgi:O-antigen/teichoic acid export membrane protein
MDELLRKSEKIFKTDMVYVFRNGTWSFIGQVFSICCSFILSILFAHYLSKDSYGSYKFIISLTSILGALSLSGIGTAVIQSIAQGKEKVLDDGVRLTLRWGFVVTLSSLVVAIYYFLSNNNELAFALLIFAVCSPIISAYGQYGLYWVGKKDFKTSTLYFMFSQLLTTMTMIVAVVLKFDVVGLIATSFIFGAMFSFFSYKYVTNKYEINQIGDDHALDYGKHLSFMNFFGSLANQLDKILLFHFIGPSQLAIYSFATLIPEQVRGSYKNIFGISLPKFSVLSKEALRKSIIDKIYRLTTVSIIIVIAYWIIAPYFFSIFFPKYLSAVIYSQIYVIGLIAIPGITLFSTYFQVNKDTATLYKITLLSNTITIVYGVILIYNFGIWGAVIENGLSWFSMFFIGAYYFYRAK